jgi:hypothetical protein
MRWWVLAAAASLRLLQPGCEVAEANAERGLAQCNNNTAQFNAEKEQYEGILDDRLAELEPKLEYWENLYSEVRDEFHGNPYLSPSGVLANTKSVSVSAKTPCVRVQQLHEQIATCEALLSQAIVDGRKTLTFKEELIRSKTDRIEGYKEQVRRMREMNVR